ncbi:xylose isomerase [Mageeibacillus indolicus]|uniref:Xylose isomerase n=1 Tax=Mageeibacillus indolicus TaxID=884684 RepID=A0A2J8B259_9FIRM|nr:xylose isomerase [Mageeibacillus indolicus]KFA57109.1 xylose isomerase [Mageeibacillus indolicus 0009-5]PNH18853.1 xylose isomerase [Mageeibacillus indolicus]
MKFFENVPKVKYEGSKSTNPFAFKYYNPEAVIAGKKMKDHLKFAMSWWHTMTATGQDQFGSGTMSRIYDGQTEPLALAKARVDAAFDFMEKLNIEYFCFHDADLAPEGNSLQERNENLQEMVSYLKQKMAGTSIKLLWGTSNCFSNPRFMHGAATSCEADVFAWTATQLKNAIDATIALGGKGYVFWGGREGYETLLNTDVGLEMDNYARMLKMAVAYARSKGYTGDFYIEPKPKEPTKHQYDFDVATCVAFLEKYDLMRDFKVNIEANHATLAGHTFQHELRMARTFGVFGSVDANQGDSNLGWDTDQFPGNIYDTTLAMYEILKAGGFTNGGLNFDAKVRRPSFTPEDIAYAYILGMDTFALGLIKAQQLIEDGRIDRFVAEKYASYKSGIGAEILSGKTSLPELEAYALKKGEPKLYSGRQEYLESVVNNVIFNGNL